VIPTIITQSLTRDVIYLGNLNATRDLTYVSDTVRGFLCAAESLDVEGNTYNLGTGEMISIGELANEIISIVGRPIEIKIDKSRLRPEKSEVKRLLSDNRLAAEKLGWSPTVDLRSGLKKTIEWISANLSHFQADTYQI
jgi:dTDP-glucose 4,6-dehydratase